MGGSAGVNPVVKFFKRMKRYDAGYFRRKLYDLRIRKAVESMAGAKGIDEVLPDFRARHRAEGRRFTETLLPFYREYVDTVSNEIMAASLETSALLLLVCHIRRPLRILDLGSGFSSLALRLHASRTEPRPEVWSVDDDAEWLERTGAFLSRHGMSAGNLATWDAWTRADPGRYDLVFYDFGPFDLRKSSLGYVLDRVEPGGVLVLDDMHSADYGLFVKETLTDKGFRYESLRSYTNDRYGRYAFLAHR